MTTVPFTVYDGDRRTTVGDRRMGERVPREWERAQPLVADHLHRLTETQKEHDSRLIKIEQGQAETRREIRSAKWVLSSVVAVGVLVGSTAVVQFTRHYTDQALAPAALSQQERVEEIVDVLPDIGAGPGEHLERSLLQNRIFAASFAIRASAFQGDRLL